MMKLSIAIRLMPADRNTKAEVPPRLKEALDQLCANEAGRWWQEASGPFEGDICVKEGPAITFAMTTTDILDRMRMLAEAVKASDGWTIWSRSYAVGWDNDGFILKMDFGPDGDISIGSPNWLLDVPTWEMTNIRLSAKEWLKAKK